MSYISLLNESVFTGVINATTIKFIGEVDFTEASPIIGLVDNSTLEIIDDPLTGVTLNKIQIKDAGVTNVKIVSMDASKLTGNIQILSGEILMVGSLTPNVDAVYNIGAALLRWLNLYCINGSFSSSINCPLMNSFNGISIQYNGSTKLTTTNTGILMTGIIDMNNNNITNANTITSQAATALTLTGSTSVNLNYGLGANESFYVASTQIKKKKLVIYDVSGNNFQWTGMGLTNGAAYLSFNSLQNFSFNVATSSTTATEVFRMGTTRLLAGITLDMNNFNINNVPTLTNPIGINIQFNGSTKLATTNTGITVTGTTDTTIINNASGVSLQFNGSTKLVITNTGITVIGTIDTTTINNSSGVSLQFNGSTKLATTNTGITVTGTTDTTIINNALGVSLQYNGSTKLATTDTGITLGGNINLNSNNIVNGGSISGTSGTFTISTTTPIINNSSGVSLQYNSSTKLAITNIGILMNGLIDMNNNNINNTNTIISQAVTALTLTGSTNINLNIATGTLNSVYVGGDQIKNKKLVLYTIDPTSEHQFYGFGINSGTLRYQAGISSDGHRFYCGLTSTTSQELFSIYNSGLTSQRSLNMNNNNISNIGTLGVTTLNATNIVATGTVKTAGFVSGHRIITTNTTLTETDCIISVSTSVGSITITLPLISSLTYAAGRQYVIKDISGLAKRNNIIINTTSPNLLDGQSTGRLNVNYSSLSIYCNGTDYNIF